MADELDADVEASLQQYRLLSEVMAFTQGICQTA
jgi:hypothetical protein